MHIPELMELILSCIFAVATIENHSYLVKFIFMHVSYSQDLWSFANTWNLVTIIDVNTWNLALE